MRKTLMCIRGEIDRATGEQITKHDTRNAFMSYNNVIFCYVLSSHVIYAKTTKERATFQAMRLLLVLLLLLIALPA